MPKSIRVEVMGRDYALRVSEESEPELREVAASVDEKMRAFQKNHPGQAPLTAAVIIALGLADELHQVQKKLDNEQAEARSTIRGITQELEEVLTSDEHAEGA